MADTLRLHRRLGGVLLLAMATQALLGLVFPRVYRDADWIRATWFGNDLVTLVVAVPLLGGALAMNARGSVRGTLLWVGMLGYAAYNYAFYLFGAALNPFFLLYLVALVVAVVLLILILSAIDINQLAACFHRSTRVRLVGSSLVFVGGALGVVWLTMWAAYVFAGRPTPVELDALRLVAALDLSIMVPTLTIGGVLLWRRAPWGFVIAAIASIQSALYLFVLSVNSVVAIRRGLVEAPAELPIWAPLACVMTTIALLLFSGVRHGAVAFTGLTRRGTVASDFALDARSNQGESPNKPLRCIVFNAKDESQGCVYSEGRTPTRHDDAISITRWEGEGGACKSLAENAHDRRDARVDVESRQRPRATTFKKGVTCRTIDIREVAVFNERFRNALSPSPQSVDQ